MLSSLLLLATLAAPTTEIKVSQAGYPTEGPKLALVAATTPAKVFSVRGAADGAVVLEGSWARPCRRRLGRPRAGRGLPRSTSPAATCSRCPASAAAASSPVGPDVFARPLYLAMRSFYGQRCGTAVDLGPEFPGYRYPACHLERRLPRVVGQERAARRRRRAGTTPATTAATSSTPGITTGTLLWTYELFGDASSRLQLDIPESGNAVPDVLDEIRWNLDWMLSMQDEDGGVWHKQTSERFSGFVDAGEGHGRRAT